MLIPQAMAYAMLAGLPPIVGLYASVAPLAVYALLGTSRQLAVGPVAIVSLLTATGVGALVAQGTDEYLTYAVLLAVMVGGIQIAMSVLRLGYLVNFLSHPVLSGFTSAAAFIIGLNQLKHLLGLPIPRSHHVHTIVLAAFQGLPDASMATVAIGLAAIAAMVGVRRWTPRIPGPLVAVGGATLAVVLFDLGEAGVSLVGRVPAGLPAPRFPAWDAEAARDLLPIALAISFVGFMESISVAKVFATKHGYRLRADRELLGLGAANLASAVFGGYAVTGGFSRSAVNDQAGAKTPFAGAITALVIAGSLVFLTPLFAFMPKAVLASIILVAVYGLIDVAEVRHLWRTDRVDLGLLVLTFAATLVLGMEQGILVGAGASMFVFVARRTRPHFAVLGRLPGTETYRNVDNFPQAERTPGVLAVRFDAAFYYGNVTFLEETLRSLEAAAPERVRAVILDAAAINSLDSSAAHALGRIVDDYRARDVRLLLAGAKGPVREVLDRTGLDSRIGSADLPLTVCDAMAQVIGSVRAPAAFSTTSTG
jgi:SulP family sulfate permease